MSTPDLPTDPAEVRAEVLARFERATGLPAIKRVVQRGRDSESARYTFELKDGRRVRAGNINVLWSHAEFAKVFLVACGVIVAPMKPADWRPVIGGLIGYATDVEEPEGESFEDSVREWLDAYLAGVSVGRSRDDACPQGLPFNEDGQLHIHAQSFAKYIRREFSENVQVGALRTALTDLGYARASINYRRNKRGAQASYYVGEHDPGHEERS